MLNSVTALRTEKNNKKKTTKTTIGLISKKKSTLYVQHTFLSLPLLVHDYNVRLSGPRFTQEVVYVLTPKNCYLCSFSLSFSLPLIFTLLATTISHFLTNVIKFSCCVSNEGCFICFLPLALALCYPRQLRH